MKYPGFLKANSETPKIYTYPYQIGLQTLEITQANLFYTIFADIAAGLQVRRENGLTEIHDKMKLDGATNEILEDGMAYFEKYDIILRSSVLVRFLTEMVAQWEYYLKKMQHFVQLNLTLINPDKLTREIQRNLKRLHALPILEQISTIQAIVEDSFEISEPHKIILSEMFLLRHLGQHNRWECDQKYLKSSYQGEKWQLGHIRLIDQAEIRDMYEVFSSTVRAITKALSITFVKAQHILD